ncbi:MAG TPA: hypothetical protein VIH59_21220, partial [Candidatus Tectomicrobia bacterium]
MQGDAARAYLRLTEAKQQQGRRVALRRRLTLRDRLAIVGGAGSGKSILLASLGARLAIAAQQEERLPVDLPAEKTTLVPLLIPLRYFREYIRLCEQAPQERL